jgi:hypothetical protein
VFDAWRCGSYSFQSAFLFCEGHTQRQVRYIPGLLAWGTTSLEFGMYRELFFGGRVGGLHTQHQVRYVPELFDWGTLNVKFSTYPNSLPGAHEALILVCTMNFYLGAQPASNSACTGNCPWGEVCTGKHFRE